MPHSMKADFTHFVGIDWSGAKGTSHPGLAVAVADISGQVQTVPPDFDASVPGKKHWSRMGLAQWIRGGCGLPESAKILIGIDSAFALPWVDHGHYFPAHAGDMDAVAMWDHIDALCCGDADYYAGGFVTAYRDHVHLTKGGKGRHYERRLRVAEHICIREKYGPCESVYHLIGPSQVGMSAFSVQRMLADLYDVGHIAVWPFHTYTQQRIVLVEIYAALFAAYAGHRGKFRCVDDLRSALSNLGCKTRETDISEHQADAVITAAGLRELAHRAKYWNPADLSDTVRRTEGWIFGIA